MAPHDVSAYFAISDIYEGAQLKEQVDSDDMDLELSKLKNEGAVYFWLKKLSPPGPAIANAKAFSAWVYRAMGQTDGIVHGSIGHLGHVNFTLGNARISLEKLEAIESLANTMVRRREIQKMFASLDYKIALYVGETGDLAGRIGDHLRGRTDFSKRLTDYGFDWSQLGLRYFLVPPTMAPAERKALERIIATMLLAPATSRAG